MQYISVQYITLEKSFGPESTIRVGATIKTWFIKLEKKFRLNLTNTFNRVNFPYETQFSQIVMTMKIHFGPVIESGSLSG